MSPAPLAEITIDLDAIAANYKMLSAKSSPARTAVALKADAYGMGVAQVAPIFEKEGCDAFFVATLEEAIELRALTKDAEIFILNGVESGDGQHCIDHSVIPVLNDMSAIERWAAFARESGDKQPAVVHLDTGMNRLGIPIDDARLLTEDKKALLEPIDLRLVMSHLACAGQPGHLQNTTQLERFNSLRHALPSAPASIANTGGVMMGAPYHMHMTRPGIGLYGGVPFAEVQPDFKEVVRLTARILQVKTVKAGESVGYDATWTAKKDSDIAIVALGYADGYLVGFSNSGVACIDETRVPVIGRVSMDLLALDVSALPSDKVRPGQKAVFIGDGITLNEAAALGDMHMYQLLTSIGRRVKRRFVCSELTSS